MTAHAMNSDRERCLAVGMDGYLSKPIDPALLFAVVEQQSDGSVSQIAVGSAGSALPLAAAASADVAPKMFDEDALLERVSGDHKLMIEVIRLFLDDLPARLVAIESAVKAGNAEAIRTTSHALKGAAGNLSVEALVEAARVLERIGADVRLHAAEAAWKQLSIEAASVGDILRRHAAAAA
jgi:HPt (histidine-containing phosphotransfer) domain-containing protein